MQNIDPIYFLLPLTAIAFSFGLVLYWHFKRRLTKWVLLYSFIAYFGAIALKYIVQIPTIVPFEKTVNGNVVALGIYYGLQTSIFEVGGAYLVANYARGKAHITLADAEGYGISLALWENGVFLGAISWLLNYLIYYEVLSSGSNFISQTLFNELPKSLFYPPAEALPLIGLSLLERVSSLLAHFSWGILVVYAVVYKRKKFLAFALPMGFLDFLVPFGPVLGAVRSDVLIFALSSLFLVIALASTKNLRNEKTQRSSPALSQTTEKRQ